MNAHEGKGSAAELGGFSSRADYPSPKGKKHANPSDEDEAKAVHQACTPIVHIPHANVHMIVRNF
jgi:hypothetical protein